jgi:hypothetical protein
MNFSIIHKVLATFLLSAAWIDGLRRQHKLWQATVPRGRKDEIGSR